MNHCQECHTHGPLEAGGFEIVRPAPSCPGCQECASNERKWMDAERRARKAETARLVEVGKRGDAQAEAARLRAELLEVRQLLGRERAGQGKCNSGHVSDRALWDCPVCVEAMRLRLAKAERLCKAISEYDCAWTDGRRAAWLSVQAALEGWEKGNG